MPPTTSQSFVVDVDEEVVVRWNVVALATPAVLILPAMAVASALVRPGNTAAVFAPTAFSEKPVNLAAVSLSIWLCAAALVVKMPPTTSQSFVVDDEVLDDVEGVVVVVVEVSTEANTGFGGVVWVGVVAFGGSVGSVRVGPTTVPNVVVGSVLRAPEQADATSVTSTALARKTFDFGMALLGKSAEFA